MTSLLERVEHEYAGKEERPLGSFLVVMAGYGGVVAGLAGYVRARKIPLPDNVSWSDIALLSVATHKIARLIAKDSVTSPLRAPFVRYAGTSGEAELAEEVRGSGPRKAIGELVTCPFCLGHWVATGLVFGLVVAPRPTRLLATVFTCLTAADVLQFGYDAVQAAA